MYKRPAYVLAVVMCIINIRSRFQGSAPCGWRTCKREALLLLSIILSPFISSLFTAPALTNIAWYSHPRHLGRRGHQAMWTWQLQHERLSVSYRCPFTLD